MDYDIQHNARCCSITGREFAPGESYYSVLIEEPSGLKRCDVALDAWQGPPQDAIGWWKSRIPDKTSAKKHWAPNDLMLNFWDDLASQPDKQDMRYVLTLLLVRRRVLQLEEEAVDSQNNEMLSVFCPRRDTSYQVPAIIPDAERIEQIQEQLAALLQ